LDRAIIGILLIAIITIVFATSIAYYIAVQTDQTQNNTFPTPTPSPEPTQSPATTPTPKPTGKGLANLIVNVEKLSFRSDGGMRLLIKGNITNLGAQTAYNVRLRIQTWFPNGSEGMDTTVTLNNQLIWILPFEAVNITGGDTYTLTSRWFPENLVVSVPGEFWLDESGAVYPYDLISSYLITPLWDDTP